MALGTAGPGVAGGLFEGELEAVLESKANRSWQDLNGTGEGEETGGSSSSHEAWDRARGQAAS